MRRQCNSESTGSIPKRPFNISTASISTMDSLQITEQRLLKYPLETHKEEYLRMGETVKTLILVGVDESDAEQIFSMFASLESLTLERMTLLEEDLNNHPTEIQELQIIDCKINKPLMEKWLKELQSKLLRLTIHRSDYALSLGYDDCSLSSLIKDLPNLKYLSVKGNYMRINANLPKLEFLCCIVIQSVIAVEYISYVNCGSSLKSLILLNCPKKLELLLRFPQLEYLKIISSVDSRVRDKLMQLNCCKHLDVSVFPQATEENLIFKLLNEDCLIKIVSYWPLKDWIAAREADPRFDVMSPHRKIFLDSQFATQFPIDKHLDFYKTIGQSCRELTLSDTAIHWSPILPHFNIKKLSLSQNCELNAELLNAIPDGLECLHLSISNRTPENVARSLFRRLSPTLTQLLINQKSPFSGLSELRNLKHLRIHGLCGINLEEQLANKDQLEVLRIQFDQHHRDYLELTSMQNLKVLDLSQLRSTLKWLDPHNLPSLEEIRISFHDELPVSDQILVIERALKFQNIQRLGLPIERNICNLEKVYKLKNLTSLEFRQSFVDEQLLVEMVRNMPKLETVRIWNKTLSWKGLVDLRRVVREQRRKLTLNAGPIRERHIVIS